MMSRSGKARELSQLASNGLPAAEEGAPLLRMRSAARGNPACARQRRCGGSVLGTGTHTCR